MRANLTRTFLVILSAVLIASFTTVGAQVTSVRATERQMRSLLGRLETKTDRFKQTFDSSIDRTPINGTNREDRIMDLIQNFETSTDMLTSRYKAHQPTGAEAADVLNKALLIDRFMNRNTISRESQAQWASLRRDLNTLASYYTYSWNWTSPMNSVPSYPPYVVNDNQVRALLTRMESRTDIFKRQMNRALDRSRYNNTDREDLVNKYIMDFENSSDRLKQRFDARESVMADASDVLTHALFIDRFMAENRLANNAEATWRRLRTDLNTLSNYYRISWNWNQVLPPYPVFPGPYTTTGFDARLTGTYRLNNALSDNVSTVVDRSLGYYPANQRETIKRNLERRLHSPVMMAIEKTGNSVLIASTNSPRTAIVADGVARTETNNRGRRVTTRITDSNSALMIDHTGDRVNDYFVTFMPVGRDQLKVTRKIYLENRNDLVTVSSVYDKINATAEWSNVNNGRPWTDNTSGRGDFYVLNGTRLTAALRDRIDSRTNKVGDRFTMTVTGPSQYSGSTIEGRISNIEKSDRFSGRANVTLDFDTIRLPNGRTYAFAGIIDSAQGSDGDSIRVNNEGSVQDGNQTTATVTRAGIGAVIGAIIGAVTGGGEGAAIGAGVGAGAGAGSILITGKDNIDIPRGSVFSITATGPRNIG